MKIFSISFFTSLFTYCFVLIAVLLGSCNALEEEVSVPDYHPEFAVPIIKDAIINIPDIWQSNDPNQSLVIEPDGRMIFQYKSPQTTVLATEVLGGTLTYILTETFSESGTKITLLPPDLGIELAVGEAFVKSGQLNITFLSNNIFGDTLDIRFTIPELSKDGMPLEITTSAALAGSLSIDVSEYTVTPNNNQITVNYTATNSTGVPQDLQSVTVFFVPRVQVLKGFLGRQVQVIPQATIPIDLFDDRFLNGTIQFAEPRISAQLENAFGVPVRSQIDILNAHRANGLIIPIDARAIDNKDINYPTIEEIGESKSTELFLDHTNSNLPQVFSEAVTAVEYGLTAIINPENDSSIVSFVTDTSFFTVQVFVEIPVIGSAANFVVEDTYEVDFTAIEEDIQEGEFKLIVENAVPVEANIQFYFLDNTGNVIDSLFQERATLVEGAPVDEQGNTTGTTETTSFIPVTAAQLNQIRQAHSLQVHALFKTSGANRQAVPILANQEIQFRLGLKFKI